MDETVEVEKIEIIYEINESRSFIREAKITDKNQRVKKNINHLIDQLFLRNVNLGIDTQRMEALKKIFEVRVINGECVYF